MNYEDILIMLRKSMTDDDFNADVGPFYTNSTLQALRKHFNDNFFFESGCGWVEKIKKEEYVDSYSCPDF